jgi:hypothetical protein
MRARADEHAQAVGCRTEDAVKRGIYIQNSPTHWRWDKAHNPWLCVLCWVERIGLRIGLLHDEHWE